MVRRPCASPETFATIRERLGNENEGQVATPITREDGQISTIKQRIFEATEMGGRLHGSYLGNRALDSGPTTTHKYSLATTALKLMIR